jgi:prophage tail gpP-like protein
MHFLIKTSPGEFLDKLTILEIKSERIQDPAKLENVNHELDHLRSVWNASPMARTDVSATVGGLKTVNEALWDIEDKIRIKEGERAFDDEFIQLARSVYHQNDRRAALKRKLNLDLGAEIIEEKSYADYRPE